MSFSSYISLFLIMMLVCLEEVGGGGGGGGINQSEECSPSSCNKKGPRIRFPFRIIDRQPAHCGIPGFELSCRGKHTMLEFPVPAVNLSVESIDYKSEVVKLKDPDGCLLSKLMKISTHSVAPFAFDGEYLGFTLFNCTGGKRAFGVDVFPCVGQQVVVVDFQNDIARHSLVGCSKIFSAPASVSSDAFSGHEAFRYLNWSGPDCSRCEAIGNGCRLKDQSSRETECFVFPTLKSNKGTIKKVVATGVTLGTAILAVILFLAYRYYMSTRQENKTLQRIEKFLEEYMSFKPSRYSYGDIKHITENFKEKLGEGSFGTVYKGRLSSEFFVAVKILNCTKGNGDEFINEVRTIGQIHHVNVVRLVGYCADGFRRAIVFEFLVNGSLQRYIASPGTDQFLGWKKLQGIALGIAKGIEYLHRGCDQRILHFDIKPHNVLLGTNFTPKIADFGLAKLCSKERSIVSMTSARGTMGYIAPEMFSRNFGNVSDKSDVYSFGVLLLEMVGGEKINDATERNKSNVYYPKWIYNLLEEGNDLHIGIEEDGDTAIAKNLAIVGLWCVQWHPADRPSMTKAVQMLEAGGTATSMPPNPFSSVGSTERVPNMPRRLEAIIDLE